MYPPMIEVLRSNPQKGTSYAIHAVKLYKLLVGKRVNGP